MNKLFLVLFFLVLSISAHAYSKKIVMVSYATDAEAKGMLEKISNQIPALNALAKEHDFKYSIKRDGDFHLVVAEVFHDRETVLLVVKKIREHFIGAYINSSTASDIDYRVEYAKQIASGDIDPTQTKFSDFKISYHQSSVDPRVEYAKQIASGDIDPTQTKFSDFKISYQSKIETVNDAEIVDNEEVADEMLASEEYVVQKTETEKYKTILRKIIMATYSTNERAQRVLNNIPSGFPFLDKLSKEYDFQYSVKEENGFYVLVAEVFYDAESVLSLVKEIRKAFEDAIIIRYRATASDNEVVSSQKYQSSLETRSKPVIAKSKTVLRKIIMATYSTNDIAQRMIENIPREFPLLDKLSKEQGFEYSIKEEGGYHILVAEVFYDAKSVLSTVKEIRKAFEDAIIIRYRVSVSGLEDPFTQETTSDETYTPDLDIREDATVEAEEEVKLEPEVEEEVVQVEENIVETVDEEATEVVPSNDIATEENTTEVIEKDINSSVENNLTKAVDENISAVAKTDNKKIKAIEESESVKATTEKKVEAKEPKKISEDDGFFSWWYLLLLAFLGLAGYYGVKFKKKYDEY